MPKKGEQGFQKNNTDGFVKGTSGNSAGGLKKRAVRSKIRQTIESLREVEPLAIENIKRSVNGQEVDKEVLQSSKWCIEKIVSFTTAAISEEEKNTNIKLKNLEAARAEEETEQEDEDSSTPRPAVFQLTVAK